MDVRRVVNVSILIVTFTAGLGAAVGLITLSIQGNIWHSFLAIAIVVGFIGSMLSLPFAFYALLFLGLTEGIYKTMAPSLFTLAAKDVMLVFILVRLLYTSLRSRDYSWFRQRITIPAVLLAGYVTAMGAAPSTYSPSLALAGMRSWLLWLPVYYPVWVIFDTKQKAMRLLHIFCAVSIPLSLYGIYQSQAGYAHLQPVGELYRHSIWFTGRALSIFNSPHLFGNFSALVVLVSLGLSLHYRSMPRRLFYIGCAALAGGGVMASDVRGAFLGLALGVLVFLLLARRKLVIGLVVAITALLSWGYIVPEDVEGTSKIRAETSAQLVMNRITTPLTRALTQVTEYPLGYGIATGAGSGRIFGHLRARAAPRDLAWIENEFGRALTEIGLPGFFFWIWLLWLATRNAIAATRKASYDYDHYLFLGMTSAMFVILAQLMIGGALYDAAAGIYFWVFAAMTGRVAQALRAEQDQTDAAVAGGVDEQRPTAAPQSPAIASAHQSSGQ